MHWFSLDLNDVVEKFERHIRISESEYVDISAIFSDVVQEIADRIAELTKAHIAKYELSEKEALHVMFVSLRSAWHREAYCREIMESSSFYNSLPLNKKCFTLEGASTDLLRRELIDWMCVCGWNSDDIFWFITIGTGYDWYFDEVNYELINLVGLPHSYLTETYDHLLYFQVMRLLNEDFNSPTARRVMDAMPLYLLGKEFDPELFLRSTEYLTSLNAWIAEYDLFDAMRSEQRLQLRRLLASAWQLYCDVMRDTGPWLGDGFETGFFIDLERWQECYIEEYPGTALCLLTIHISLLGFDDFEEFCSDLGDYLPVSDYQEFNLIRCPSLGGWKSILLLLGCIQVDEMDSAKQVIKTIDQEEVESFGLVPTFTEWGML